MVALAASCSQAVGSETIEDSSGDSSQTLFSFKKAEIQEISLKVEKEKSSLEDVLLEYVKRSNGEIDLTRCSVDLKTPYGEIEQALENLGAKGKIRIELRTEG
jgi:predicted CopG family antitoxin